MKTPSFNFYPNNWLASSRIMTMLPEQEGAYIRLLAYQWNSEYQTIPEDDQELAMLSRLGDRWHKLGTKIKACFHAVEDMPGHLRNDRLFFEYQRVEKCRERKSAGGRKSAAVRWGGNDTSNPIAEHQVSDKILITNLQDTCNREHRTGNIEHRTEKLEKKEDSFSCSNEAPDPQFTRCWEAFEKYGVKKIALKYWRKYSKADRDKIEAAIPDYNEAVRAGRPRKQFEGWINPEHRLWDMDWRKAAEVAREKNAPPKLINTFHQKTKDKSLLAF